MIGTIFVNYLFNISILRLFGSLIVDALEVLIKINLVVLVIARQLLPAIHSRHEEAFAKG